MKTFQQFQEALIARVSKDKKNSGIDPRILEKFPNKDPLKPGDYKWLKKQSVPLDTAMKTEEAMAVPTNNVGDGKIAGTVEAGDDPPKKKNKRGSGVKNRKKKKKKTYAYGGRGSRKMWMA